MTVKPGKLNVKKGGRGQKMINAQDDALRLALAVSEDQEDKLKARQAARKPKPQDASHEADAGHKNMKTNTRKPRLERMKEVIQAKQVQKKKLKTQRRKDASGSSETLASEPTAKKRRVAFA